MIKVNSCLYSIIVATRCMPARFTFYFVFVCLVVDKFTFFGSTLSRIVHIDDKVNARIAKASAAFGRLRGSIWESTCILFITYYSKLYEK